MRICVLKTSTCHFLIAALLLAAFSIACQPGPATNTNTNANASNLNANVTNTNANTTGSAATINAREPDSYTATLVLSAVTEGGDRVVGVPELSAKVARNGADRRVEFNLPNNETLIYIDHADQHYVIAQSRKQYAELTPEATGFQLQKLMTPGQIAEMIRRQKGFQYVGDEQYQGHLAEKYHYTGATQTNTQAGTVTSEINIFIDKATGLPLHAELFSEATGQVEGMRGARLVAEMRDIQTTADPSLFQVPPQGYTKVEPQQVRQQIDALTGTVAAIVKALLTNLGQQGTTTTTTVTTTTASPSPSASQTSH
ncbi:MAG: hypothetical protein AUG51_08880 [Acidobacteria bacterium 13_1_20CM_3_53_8]|nr:MAG: hypothetical protein AUG51_08880 [Acidobacteria bacterium 13_1_20CM_3_53_8]